MNLIILWRLLGSALSQPATQCRGFACVWPILTLDLPTLLYAVAVSGLSLYGFNALFSTCLFLWQRRGRPLDEQAAPVVGPDYN